MEKIYDIKERTFQFAKEIVNLCRPLAKHEVLVNQLLRSGPAVGALCEEAYAGESKADFIHKYSIALKEARETLYWLRLFSETGIIKTENAKPLMQEADELIRIILTIILRLKNNKS